MRLRIVYTRSKGVGKEVRESIYDGDRATIGRGTDQSIQLSGHIIPLHHSRLALRDGQLTLTATSGHTFSVNDRPMRHAVLSPGDVVYIAGHKLTVGMGDDNSDVSIEVELGAEEVEPLRERFTTRIWQLGLPERTASWTLFVVILCIGLVVPAIGFLIGHDTLRESPLPDDSMWLAGDLHQTHAFMGNECGYCHAQAFERVRDEDCLYCHLSVNHHFDTEAFGRDYHVGDRCADCHREHSEGGSIVRRDQEICSTCHADLGAAGYAKADLEPATDFFDDHPPFRLAMTDWDDATGEFTRQRIYPWDNGFAEESNLSFPHDIHLSEEGIESPEGSVVMECGDCHQPERGGINMSRVTMEQHCADCHQLTFDPATPDRVVPHGSPPELMQMLREYYALQFVSPETAAGGEALPEPSRTAQRPGRERRPRVITELLLDEGELDSFSDQARAFVESRVDSAAKNLFERQTCVECHEISRRDDADVPWHVEPVEITNDWMPLARFSHGSHKNMRCDGCHKAGDSTTAADVLMPDIGNCRGCHGGEDTSGRLQSTCVTCHEFHLESQGPMGELIPVDQLEDEDRASTGRMAEER